MATAIEHRVKHLEMRHQRAKYKLPALILAFIEKPSHEQQMQLDEAKKQGRPFVCLIQTGDTIYTNHHKEAPPWVI